MEGSSLALLGRLVVSLGVVLALFVLAGRLLGRRAGGGGRGPASVEVLTRRPLTKGASVALVRAGGRALVLGVTDSSVTVLAEADPGSLEPDGSEAPGTALPWGDATPGLSWKGLVEALRARTARRS